MVIESLNWIAKTHLPLGDYVRLVFDKLSNNYGFFFEQLSFFLLKIINSLLFILQWPNPLVSTIIISSITFVMRRCILVSLFTAMGLLLIINQGYWKETTETLALVLVSTFMSMAIGVPLGVLSARRKWLYAIVRISLDLMQTIPTFVYLIPVLVLFGLGMVPGLIATIIFSIPASVRLTRLGVISTPPDLTEAALAFGATPGQVFRKVELPFAIPQIMAALTQTIMLSLSMVVIAALVGADGLGVPVLRALNTVDIGKGFEAGFCIVILAIILDRMFSIVGVRDTV
ncbi:L-proline glycine betaine ABC transport system permease protein ProW [Liberibacter crescens BT-1]|uniref:L-proline glycine betaine ABC transport system permease protein ProW n=1 Tax=Liberibacter crescens (strain BT-1) TaxID=1215343 RepID=L0EW58_LIBCB|nr:L-proline glycine betaine ABC transport system permease protein ProW [Liberibacter crescens BT-1]